MRKAGEVPYPGHGLTEDEDLVLELRPHWVTLVMPAVVFGIAVLGGSIVYGLVPGGTFETPLRWMVVVASVALLLWFSVRPILRWAATRLRVTSERLLWRRGLLGRYAREIPLERLTDVTVSQSLFEKLFGLGDVMVRVVGEPGRVVMADLPRPDRILDAINRQVAEREARMGVHPGAPPPPPGWDGSRGVVEQLQHLAELRDRGDISQQEFRRIKDDLIGRL